VLKTQICVTLPQCVKFVEVKALALYATKLSFRITHYVVNYEITIPWPSFQATPLHCDVFFLTTLIAKRRGSEAWNPSNNVILPALNKASLSSPLLSLFIWSSAAIPYGPCSRLQT